MYEPTVVVLYKKLRDWNSPTGKLTKNVAWTLGLAALTAFGRTGLRTYEKNGDFKRDIAKMDRKAIHDWNAREHSDAIMRRTH